MLRLSQHTTTDRRGRRYGGRKRRTKNPNVGTETSRARRSEKKQERKKKAYDAVLCRWVKCCRILDATVGGWLVCLAGFYWDRAPLGGGVRTVEKVNWERDRHSDRKKKEPFQT